MDYGVIVTAVSLVSDNSKVINFFPGILFIFFFQLIVILERICFGSNSVAW